MLHLTFGAMNRSYVLNQSTHQSIKSHLHCGTWLYILCGGTALVLSATEINATNCIRAHNANVQMQLHATSSSRSVSLRFFTRRLNPAAA